MHLTGAVIVALVIAALIKYVFYRWTAASARGRAIGSRPATSSFDHAVRM